MSPQYPVGGPRTGPGLKWLRNQHLASGMGRLHRSHGGDEEGVEWFAPRGVSGRS